MKKRVLLLVLGYCIALPVLAQSSKPGLKPAPSQSSPRPKQQQTTVTIEDHAQVENIVTGNNNQINITQVLLKSDEHRQLKADQDRLRTKIQAKAARCSTYSDADAVRDCRQDLVDLNKELDALVKAEARFRDDVLRLATAFTTISLNSERLRQAKAFFDAGKFREADQALNSKEIIIEGEALLAKQAHLTHVKRTTDSLLHVKADELALKARLKATDYADPTRYDSAEFFFRQSFRFANDLDNVWSFASLLLRDNQSQRAIDYFEQALKLTTSEAAQAGLNVNLGLAYSDQGQATKAEGAYLQALAISERLAKANPAQYEPDLANTNNNLGNFYSDQGQAAKAEGAYLRAQAIYERLAKANPARYEPGLADTDNNLGNFYSDHGQAAKAEETYLRAQAIYERLAKDNPARYEPDLANTANNLGVFYSDQGQAAKAEGAYLQAFAIRERLAKANLARYEPDLADTANNLGSLYSDQGQVTKAEGAYLQAFAIRERLAKANPARYESDLAMTANNLGVFYTDQGQAAKAEEAYLRAQAIYERLAKDNPAQYESDMAMTANNLGVFYSAQGQAAKAEGAYLQAMSIYERLAKDNPARYEPDLANTTNNLGGFYRAQGQATKAEGLYLQALAIYERLAMVNSRRYEATGASVAYNLGICYSRLKQRSQAVQLLQQSVQVYERLSKTDSMMKAQVAACYGSLAWQKLFLRDFEQAEENARQTLAVDASQNWVRTNLGHALLLRGKWLQAQTVYNDYLQKAADRAKAKTTLLDDWLELERAGITHAAISDARSWLSSL
jgi:tetratricopeptide (TPR) repeat protein